MLQNSSNKYKNTFKAYIWQNTCDFSIVPLKCSLGRTLFWHIKGRKIIGGDFHSTHMDISENSLPLPETKPKLQMHYIVLFFKFNRVHHSNVHDENTSSQLKYFSAKSIN